LDYEGRLENIRGTIGLRPGACVPEATVLLDDVLTTGATLSECARVLRAYGAQTVYAMTVAVDE
jgi:predicted amidophosphoribosyltransferase